MTGGRPNKKKIESLALTRKVNLLMRLWHEKYFRGFLCWGLENSRFGEKKMKIIYVLLILFK